MHQKLSMSWLILLHFANNNFVLILTQRIYFANVFCNCVISRLIRGENWTIPHMLNPPRADVDNGMRFNFH